MKDLRLRVHIIDDVIIMEILNGKNRVVSESFKLNDFLENDRKELIDFYKRGKLKGLNYAEFYIQEDENKKIRNQSTIELLEKISI